MVLTIVGETGPTVPIITSCAGPAIVPDVAPTKTREQQDRIRADVLRLHVDHRGCIGVGLVKDALFGDIEYDNGWVGQCAWPFFSMVSLTRLVIPCDQGAEISAVQRQAYAAFERHKDGMCKNAEDAILAYYRENLPDLHARFGPQFANQWAPKVANLQSLSRLVTPLEVIIQESFGLPAQRLVGLLFDCTWEPSLGLAVKFTDERLSGVGTQDIIL